MERLECRARRAEGGRMHSSQVPWACKRHGRSRQKAPPMSRRQQQAIVEARYTSYCRTDRTVRDPQIPPTHRTGKLTGTGTGNGDELSNRTISSLRTSTLMSYSASRLTSPAPRY